MIAFLKLEICSESGFRHQPIEIKLLGRVIFGRCGCQVRSATKDLLIKYFSGGRTKDRSAFVRSNRVSTSEYSRWIERSL